MIDLNFAKLRFAQQKAQAKNRLDKNGNKIYWELSFDQWLKIWIDSGKWDQRGVGSGKYCMSRINDIGNYSIDNVIIQTTNQNVIEGQLGRKFPQKGRKGPRRPHSLETRQKQSEARKRFIERTKGDLQICV